MNRRNVLILQRRMVEYRLPLFRRLRERLMADGVELRVAYGEAHPLEKERRDGGEVPWGLKTRCRYIGWDSHWIVQQRVEPDMLARQDLVVVPQELRQVLAVRLLLRRGRPARRIAVWGHGRNFQSGNAGGIRERIKNRLFRRADWWFAYTELSEQAFREMGADPERITCLDNTVDVDQSVAWRESVQAEEVSRLAASLGLGGTRVGVFIGSLSPEKRLDFLFAAADQLRSRLGDFELLLVGDGPLRDRVEAFARDRSWAAWAGARRDREKMVHLALGQVILNPGMVGLGILDGFAAGLPLVTTDCRIHSPEIAYLRSGTNGIMTADCLDEFVQAAEALLRDDRRRGEFASQGRRELTRLSLDAMVERFAGGILQALDCPPRQRSGQISMGGSS